jgi:hypothetical protein
MSADASSSPGGSPSAMAGDPAALQARIDFLMKEGAKVVAEKEAMANTLKNAVAGAPSRRGLRAPPVPLFHGAMGYEIDVWIREMEAQFEFEPAAYPPNDEPLRVRTAARYLKDAAADWWHHEDKAGVVSWALFVQRLHGRFRPMQQAEFARTRLKNIRQTGGVSAYCNLVQKEMAPVKNMQVDEQLFWFKEGLDPRIKAEIIKRDPKTLHGAMDDAVKIEAYLGLARGLSGSLAPRHGAGWGNHAGRQTMGQPNGPVPMEVSMMQEEVGYDPYGYPAHTMQMVPGGPSSTPAATASAFDAMVARMENMEKMMVASMQGRGQGGSSNGSSSSGSRRNPTDRVPGLEPGEVDRLRREGKCFRCKQKGHMKRDCPRTEGAAKPLNA